MNFKHDTLCEVQGSISSIFWLQGPPDVLYLTEYYEIIIIIMINVFRNEIYDNRKGFWNSNVTRYVKFKAPYLPSFDFKFLQMSCIWKNILKSSLPQLSIYLKMGNRIIDKDFEFQTWHAMWSSRFRIFLLLISVSSRCFIFERILLNHHYHHDECD